MSYREPPVRQYVTWGAMVVGLLLLVIIGLMFGIPWYRVWSQGMAGAAKLKMAEQEKQIMVETARAEAEAAVMRAEAIKTVGEMAQKYPEYRQQEFIGAFADAIQSGQVEQIIYVPTEANIPIVDAGRIGTAK